MTVTWQTIITFAAVLTAIATVFRFYNKGYDLVKHQTEQDRRIDALEKQQEEDAQGIKKELAILMRGMLACLQGLQEQGADGPVKDASAELEAYLNTKAHE